MAWVLPGITSLICMADNMAADGFDVGASMGAAAVNGDRHQITTDAEIDTKRI